LSEVNWGILPGAWCRWRWPTRSCRVTRSITPVWAKPFDGKEAARIGMINYAVPAKKLENAVTELAIS